MKRFYKSYRNIVPVTLFFLMLITLITVKIFKPLVVSLQYEMGGEQRDRSTRTLINEQEFERLVNLDLFFYLEVNNQELKAPLVYQSDLHDIQSRFFKWLFKPTESIIVSNNAKQTIHYISKDPLVIHSIIHTLISFYIIIILTSILFGYVAMIQLKVIERTLLKRLKKTSPILNAKPSKWFSKSNVTGSFKQILTAFDELEKCYRSALNLSKKQCERLTLLINVDKLTSIPNRHAFSNDMKEILLSKKNIHSILFIIRVSELNNINRHRGFQLGDQYLINIAKILKKIEDRFEKATVYRINGSDFAIIGEQMCIRDSKKIAEELTCSFSTYQRAEELDNVAHIGISPIMKNDKVEHILARSDLALAKAQTEGRNTWHFEEY
ncbi:MAG TPA: diguanylate cyclase, partial [Psychromonas hadalis]|nr:diguanylate cyclase [Psychromonas hadalis]